MKFFLDENFPKAAHALLSDSGHETFDVRGTPLEGCPDHEIFAEAQSVGAVFLTTDRDFFHTIPHLYAVHSGVVVIALRQPGRAQIMEKLSWLLQNLPQVSLENRVIQMRDKSWIAIPPL